jgi:hypothetical protein
LLSVNNFRKIDTEKKMNTFAIGKDAYSTDVSLQKRVPEEVTAFELYNTPHTFMKAKITIKKPIKY